jgi:alkanesulfonate monooxygenase
MNEIGRKCSHGAPGGRSTEIRQQPAQGAGKVKMIPPRDGVRLAANPAGGAGPIDEWVTMLSGRICSMLNERFSTDEQRLEPLDFGTIFRPNFSLTMETANTPPPPVPKTEGQGKAELKLNLIGTCPFGATYYKAYQHYMAHVEAVSGWADADGWEAILVPADNRSIDPWIVSQFITEKTKQLRPLVAVQPLYMHPFTVANCIRTISSFYDRQILINMIAGGSPPDLEQLCDQTPHDRRYDRIIEYVTIIKTILGSPALANFNGAFYKVKNLLGIPVTPNLLPEFTMSGSSSAGMAAARKVKARSIQYLRPISEYTANSFDLSMQHGTRVGIICRDTNDQAWAHANKRFPPNPEGALMREFSTGVSDSAWVKELNKEISVPAGSPYWLGPFKNFLAACPYLVGDEATLVKELLKYIDLGLRTFLLETPESAEDSKRVTALFEAARVQAMAKSASVQ